MLRPAVIVVLCLFAAKTFAAQGASTAPSDISALIQSLGDPDPAIRQHAAEKLTDMGTKVRPELLKAVRSASPQIASRASEILMKLPWGQISDPAEARRALIAYGNLNNQQRCDLIDQIAGVPGVGPVLLRLAQEDPSDEVAWRAERALRFVADEQVNDALRKLDLTDARAPILALAARAFMGVDPSKARTFLRRLIELDQSDPTLDAGELDFAYRLLCADAIVAGDLRGAASLLRQHIRQSADQAQADAATFDLFAFYADVSPAADMDRDLDEFSAALGQPEIMYAMARIAAQGANGSPLLADALSHAAYAESMASPLEHLAIGQILLQRCWISPAAREFYAAIALKDEVDPNYALRIEFFSQQRLAQLNENTENHSLVAEHAQRASELAAQMVDSSDVDPNAALAEADWHRLHVARESHDEKGQQEYLAKLMAMPADDSDASIEVYRTLISQGKTDEARAYFIKAYAASQAKLAQSHDDPEELNNLAWLCACCNQHLPEALKLSAQAVARAPDEFAFIDTAAAANAAAGNFAQAAKLEKRALALRPADDFMRHLVEKYEQESVDGK